jgi:uncharacterized spore protein YtfJ
MPDIDELIQGARDAISVSKVYGEPYEEDGVTVIPAAAVRGGGGGGGDVEGNGGTGFGLSASPVGAYVIKDGDVSWEPAVNPNRMILGWQIVSVFALFAWLRIARARRG